MATVRKETYKVILSFRFDDLEKGPTPGILLSTWTASMEFFIKVKEGFDIATDDRGKVSSLSSPTIALRMSCGIGSWARGLWSFLWLMCTCPYDSPVWWRPP